MRDARKILSRCVRVSTAPAKQLRRLPLRGDLMLGQLVHSVEGALRQFGDTLANEATPGLIVADDILPAAVGAEGGLQAAQANRAICPRRGRFLSEVHATNGTKAAHAATRPNAIATAVKYVRIGLLRLALSRDAGY